MKSVFVILGLLVCVKAAGEDLHPEVETSPTPSPTPFPTPTLFPYRIIRYDPVPWRDPRVSVQTGADLLLEVDDADKPDDFTTVEWKANGDTLVTFSSDGEPTVSDRYRGRVNVSEEDFSVKLKNLQKSDSGVYAAHVINGGEERQLPPYFVTVVDPVSPVNLTVDSVTNSSDSCDLTVTCRSLDSHQISISISTTVTCDNTTCSYEGDELRLWFSDATLRVYPLNDMIICDHSNSFSRTNDSIRIDPSLCLPPPGSESLSAGVSLCLVKTVVFSVGLVVMVTAVISVHVMERLKKKN